MSSDLLRSDLVGVANPGRTGHATATRPFAVDLSILLSAAAGIAHALSTPTHWRWWQASGVFFAVLAVVQIGMAGALFLNRTGVRTVLFGIWTNVVVVSVYVASRLVALPGQPATTAHGAPKAPGRAFLPARPEGVGAFDLFSLVVEVALIVLLVGMLPAKVRSRTTTALMCCGIAFCLFAVFAVTSRGTLR